MELLARLESIDTKDKFKLLKFDQYLEIVLKNPEVTRNAFQRVHDMICWNGSKILLETKHVFVIDSWE